MVTGNADVCTRCIHWESFAIKRSLKNGARLDDKRHISKSNPP